MTKKLRGTFLSGRILYLHCFLFFAVAFLFATAIAPSARVAFSAKSWSNIGKAKLAKVALDYPKKSKGKASRQ